MTTPPFAIDLSKILRLHNAWLRSEPDGKRADLPGANLGEVDLHGVNLHRANLRDANLRRANLYEANLYEADLSGADLREAILTRTDLRRTNLVVANLTRADLFMADLRKANLSGTDLSEADLSEADLYGANLSGANLNGTGLRDANLIAAGRDVRGYLFYAYADSDNVTEIRAGCRRFTGIAAARAHWQASHTDDPVLHADCLSLVQRIETMATARGWKLEPPTQQPQPGQERGE